MFICHKSVRNIMSKHLMARFSILALCEWHNVCFRSIIDFKIILGNPTLVKNVEEEKEAFSLLPMYFSVFNITSS